MTIKSILEKFINEDIKSDLNLIIRKSFEDSKNIEYKIPTLHINRQAQAFDRRSTDLFKLQKYIEDKNLGIVELGKKWRWILDNIYIAYHTLNSNIQPYKIYTFDENQIKLGLSEELIENSYNFPLVIGPVIFEGNIDKTVIVKYKRNGNVDWIFRLDDNQKEQKDPNIKTPLDSLFSAKNIQNNKVTQVKFL